MKTDLELSWSLPLSVMITEEKVVPNIEELDEGFRNEFVTGRRV